MSIHIIGVQLSNLVRSVLLCCEEKHITYTCAMTHAGHPISLHSSALEQLNPMGKIPVLEHGDFILSETQSILRYLDNQFPGGALQGSHAQEKALIDQWCAIFNQVSDAIFIRTYLLEFAFPKGANGQVRMDVVEAATPPVVQHLQMLSKALADRDFWVGSTVSLADCLILPMLDYLLALPHGRTLFRQAQNLVPYIERMRQRPSGQKILLKLDILS